MMRHPSMRGGRAVLRWSSSTLQAHQTLEDSIHKETKQRKIAHIKLILTINASDLICKNICNRSSRTLNTLEALEDHLALVTLENLGNVSKSNEKCQTAVDDDFSTEIQKHGSKFELENGNLISENNEPKEENTGQKVIKPQEDIIGPKSTPINEMESNKPLSKKHEITYKTTKTPIHKHIKTSPNLQGMKDKISNATQTLFKKNLTNESFEKEHEVNLNPQDFQLQTTPDDYVGVYGTELNKNKIEKEDSDGIKHENSLNGEVLDDLHSYNN